MEPLSANDPRAVGEFRLRGRLGAGGMGRVYLGFSPAGRAVAVKVVHPELARDPQFTRRFAREVAAARAVSGRYTAPVVAAGLDDDPPWLATAFVPGPSLAEFVARHGPLPEPGVWRLAAGLTEALRAVHTCALIHRDIKPANVLLAPDGPHLIDFGISRALVATSLTLSGMVVGTPGYMSPEQAEGLPTGPAADIFSLGCVLGYAATGNAPFGAGSGADVLYRVVNAQPDLTGVSGPLRDVITACLAKDPAQRPGLAVLTGKISRADPTVRGAAPASFWPAPVAAVLTASGDPAGADAMTATRVATARGTATLAAETPRAARSPAAGAQEAPRAARSPAAGAQEAPRAARSPAADAPAAYPPARHPPAPPGSREQVPAAARLMCAGAAVSLLNTIATLVAIGQVKASFLARNPLLSAAAARSVAGIAAGGVIVEGAITIALWLWLASATSRGRPWVRPAGAALFGINTLVLLGTARNPGIEATKGIGFVIWLIGLLAVIALWRGRPGSRTLRG